MYKILNSQGLGVAGRQNELIELALTHKFDGVEVDMEDLVGRHDTLGKEFACQFLQSANIDLGTFALTVDFGASEENYAAKISKLDTIADLAATLGCKRCYVLIAPYSETVAFQENFETHRARLYEVGDKFAKHNIRIGLALQAAKAQAATGKHQFIRTVEEILTLMRTVGHPNVGLCLDTWQWVVGGGAMDQLSGIDASVITEMRMADVAESADLSAIKTSERVLPGDTADSVSVKMFNYLLDEGFEGPVSIASDLGMFARVSRETVVGKLSKRLDQLILREDLTTPDEAIVADAENADADSTANETETETKSDADAVAAAADA